MQPIDISRRTLGVNFNSDGTALINIWAPQANAVSLCCGEMILALEKKDFGYWQAATTKMKEGSRYKILVDGKPPLPDPASVSQPDGVHGSSEALAIEAYPWAATAWDSPPLSDYIIYELHTGTFTPEGSFAGVETKLDYLKELGITAIELMPVAQFPGNRNWGYDGVFPFAVQNSYGGPRALQHLVETCHQKGLAVILDVVYNHLGPEGNYLGEYAPFFTRKYHTPWGNALNFDDAWCDGVRRFFVENALMWFRDFRVDALRLDAVHAIKDFSPVHILKEVRLRLNELMEQTGRKQYLIAESDLNDTRFIDPLEKGGYGLDAQWVDEFHHTLRVAAGQEKLGYYADFNGLPHLAKAYRHAFVYDGSYSEHRHKFFGTKPEENPGGQFVVFSQNHDQVGNRLWGERGHHFVSFDMQKLVAGTVLLSPYLPLLFMGEEWSEPHPFQYFVSHTDPELVEAVRQGRRAEFAALHTEGEAPDPVAETTFLQSKLQWQLVAQEPHQTLLNFYKTLIGLRKNETALKIPDRRSVSAQANAGQQTLVLHRWHQESKIACLMNFSKTTAILTLDGANDWTRLLDSADLQWKGPGGSPISDNTIRLQPESLLVLKKQSYSP